jgi:hypothetical protein
MNPARRAVDRQDDASVFLTGAGRVRGTRNRVILGARSGFGTRTRAVGSTRWVSRRGMRKRRECTAISIESPLDIKIDRRCSSTSALPSADLQRPHLLGPQRPDDRSRPRPRGSAAALRGASVVRVRAQLSFQQWVPRRRKGICDRHAGTSTEASDPAGLRHCATSAHASHGGVACAVQQGAWRRMEIRPAP